MKIEQQKQKLSNFNLKMMKFSDMLHLTIGIVTFCFSIPAQTQFNFITPGTVIKHESIFNNMYNNSVGVHSNIAT